jgi:hypothetical protein
MSFTYTNAGGQSIPVGTTRIETTGYAEPGDGGAAHFRKVSAQPTIGPKFQDASLNWWALDETVVNNFMFGALQTPLPSGTAISATTVTSRLNDFFAYCAAVRCEKGEVVGDLTVNGPVTWTLNSAYTFHFYFAGKISASGTIDTVLTIEKVEGRPCRIDGCIRVWGLTNPSSNNYSARTCHVGIRLLNSIMDRIEAIEVLYFRYAGVLMDSAGASGPYTTNQNGTTIGTLYAKRCGSGYSGAGYSLYSDYTGVTRSGTDGSLDQYAELTGVTQFPSAFAMAAPGPKFLVLGDPYNRYQKTHLIKQFDQANSKLKIFPLPDPDFPTSGDLRYLFGAALSVNGSDSNFVNVDMLDVTTNGIGVISNGLYGVTVGTISAHQNGAVMVVGGSEDDAHVDATVNYAYFEDNDFDIIRASNDHVGLHIASKCTLDLTKCDFPCAPWDDSYTPAGVRHPGYANFNGCTINTDSGLLEWEKRGHNDYGGVDITPTSPARRTLVFKRDNATVSLRPLDVPINRGFGYDSARLAVHGSGAAGQPNGTITFSAPVVQFTGNLTSGSKAVTGVTGIEAVTAGATVTGTGIAPGTTVANVDYRGKNLTLSANATGTGATALSSTWTVSGGTGSGATTAFSGLTKPADYLIYYDIAARNVTVRNLAA